MDNKKEEIKTTQNAIRLLSDYGIEVRLRKQINCISPHHDDRHPSASFYEKDGILYYKCHSCGFIGDVFSVIAEITNRSIADVLKELCGGGSVSSAYFYRKKVVSSVSVPSLNDNVVITTFKNLSFYCQSDNLHFFLCGRFGADAVNAVYQQYGIGNSAMLGGVLCAYFPYYDSDLRLVRYKVMSYNAYGKRCRDERGEAVRFAQQGKSFNLFGVHLVSAWDKSKWIAIHESEKTALIGAIVYPDKLHLSCGGSANYCNSLLANRDVLRGYKVCCVMDNDDAGDSAAQKIKDLCKSNRFDFVLSIVSTRKFAEALNIECHEKDDFSDLLL